MCLLKQAHYIKLTQLHYCVKQQKVSTCYLW